MDQLEILYNESISLLEKAINVWLASKKEIINVKQITFIPKSSNLSYYYAYIHYELKG